MPRSWSRCKGYPTIGVFLVRCCASVSSKRSSAKKANDGALAGHTSEIKSKYVVYVALSPKSDFGIGAQYDEPALREVDWEASFQRRKVSPWGKGRACVISQLVAVAIAKCCAVYSSVKSCSKSLMISYVYLIYIKVWKSRYTMTRTLRGSVQPKSARVIRPFHVFRAITFSL